MLDVLSIRSCQWLCSFSLFLCCSFVMWCIERFPFLFGFLMDILSLKVKFQARNLFSVFLGSSVKLSMGKCKDPLLLGLECRANGLEEFWFASRERSASTSSSLSITSLEWFCFFSVFLSWSFVMWTLKDLLFCFAS